ncbi:MAG: dTDP-4-dehydrorhamnose reductase [Candidatus Magasanikbacteria bacterium]
MILITGARGQLGNAFQQLFLELQKDFVSFDKDELDITSEEVVKKVFDQYKPNIIINCAAYNKVEQAEEHIEDAYKINAFGPYFLAKIANNFGAKIVHISTDYVFGGDKDGFSEKDCTKPLNIYGSSKLSGEQLVQLANKNSLIIRTSWIFGKNKENNQKNFVKTMILKAKEEKEIRVVEDQVGSPTYTNDLAKKIYELIALDVESGIYHVTNSGHCSWYEFAKKIFELAKIEAVVIPIKTSESGTKIQRPKNSILDNKRLKEVQMLALRSWQDALSDYIKELQTS